MSEAKAGEPKRVMQTIFGSKGNCQAACLASWFKIPLSEIPEIDPENSDDFWDSYRKWLAQKSYGLMIVNYHAGRAAELAENYFIVGGKSPRGLNHACIYKGDQPFHDPHPDGTFFGGNEPETIDLFVPFQSLESQLAEARGKVEAEIEVLRNREKEIRAAEFQTGFRTALWRYHYSDDEINKAYQEEIKPKLVTPIPEREG